MQQRNASEIILFCFIIMFFCITNITAQNRWAGSDLQMGAYKVGYKTLFYTDNTRSSNNGDAGRLMLIHVWYPAAENSTVNQMNYQEYFETYAYEFDSTHTTDAHLSASITAFKKEHTRYLPTKNEMNNLLSHKFNSYRNADAIKGNFPVLIYGPSCASAPTDNLALIEYLTSYGYVVVSTPTRETDYDMWSLNVESRDNAFAMGVGLELPNVDKDKIGLIGYSWGGWSTMMIALSDKRISATVSIDGAVGFALEDGTHWIKGNSFHNQPGLMTTPLLDVINGKKCDNCPPIPFSERVIHTMFQKTAYAPRTIVRISNMSHTNFCSSNLDILSSSQEKEQTPEDLKIYDGYSLMCEAVINHFDFYLKGKQEGKHFFENLASQNSDPDGFIYCENKEPLPLPPSGKEFVKLAHENGSAYVREIYKNARKLDPEIILFGNRDMINVGNSFFQKNITDEAIAFIELQLLADSTNLRALQDLAYVYEQTGQKKNAIATHQRYLKIDPTDERAKNRIAMLKK